MEEDDGDFMRIPQEKLVHTVFIYYTMLPYKVRAMESVKREDGTRSLEFVGFIGLLEFWGKTACGA